MKSNQSIVIAFSLLLTMACPWLANGLTIEFSSTGFEQHGLGLQHDQAGQAAFNSTFDWLNVDRYRGSVNLDGNNPIIADINVFHFISGLNAWTAHDDSTFTLPRELLITDGGPAQSFVQPLNIHIDSVDTLSLDATTALFFRLNTGAELRVVPLGLSPVTDWGSGVTGTLRAEFSIVESPASMQPANVGTVPLPSVTWMGGLLLAALVARRIQRSISTATRASQPCHE